MRFYLIVSCRGIEEVEGSFACELESEIIFNNVVNELGLSKGEFVSNWNDFCNESYSVESMSKEFIELMIENDVDREDSRGNINFTVEEERSLFGVVSDEVLDDKVVCELWGNWLDEKYSVNKSDGE